MHEHRDTRMDRFKAGRRWLTEDLAVNLKLSNRPVRTRMPGGVAGVPPTGGPLCRLVDFALRVFSQSCFHLLHGSHFDLANALSAPAIFSGQVVQRHAA